jgi:hypothetical protein
LILHIFDITGQLSSKIGVTSNLAATDLITHCFGNGQPHGTTMILMMGKWRQKVRLEIQVRRRAPTRIMDTIVIIVVQVGVGIGKS